MQQKKGFMTLMEKVDKLTRIISPSTHTNKSFEIISNIDEDVESIREDDLNIDDPQFV